MRQWKGHSYYKFKHIMERPKESEENLERLVVKDKSSNIDSAMLCYRQLLDITNPWHPVIKGIPGCYLGGLI